MLGNVGLARMAWPGKVHEPDPVNQVDHKDEHTDAIAAAVTAAKVVFALILDVFAWIFVVFCCV